MQTQQSRVLEMYLALSEARPTWAGALLLGIDLNETGRALALASLAAGAAGLFLEPNRAQLRVAQREGCCTFSVTTLEEAIRALKNEIRQGRGVTVALSGEASTWLAEIVERGLQPEAIAFARAPLPVEAAHCSTLVHRGGQALHGLGLAAWCGGLDLHASLQRALGDTWQIETDTALTMTDRRVQDRVLFGPARSVVDGPQGGVADAAARWLRVAPSLFPRALGRAYLRCGKEA